MENNKVRVYWNLHRNCYSVQDYKSGKVIDHVRTLTLTDAQFVVREGGKERVRDEKRKNVHAFVVGTLTLFSKGFETSEDFFNTRRVTYNPYKHDSFVTADDETPVYESSTVAMCSGENQPRVWAIV